MKKKKSLNSKKLNFEEKEQKQFYDEIYPFIHTGILYREELIKSRFKSLSEEKLKKISKFIPKINNYIQVKTKSYEKSPSKLVLQNIRHALFYELINGFLFVVDSKFDIADLCLSNIAQLKKLKELYPDHYEFNDIKFLNLYSLFYEEIKLGRMPVEFIKAFMGLYWGDRVWNQGIKNYYNDLMEKTLISYESPFRENFLIWGNLQCLNIASASNLSVKMGMIPDLLDSSTWLWEYYAALVYAANLNLDEARKYAKKGLDSILSDSSKDKTTYRPHLLHILGKIELAESEALKIIKRNPEVISVSLLLGFIYIDKKDYERAKNIYVDALRIKFDIEIATRLYCTLLFNENYKEAAILNEQIKTKSDLIFYHNLHDGMLCFLKKDFKKARKAFNYISKTELYQPFNGYIPIKKSSNEFQPIFCESINVAAKLLLAEISIFEEKYSEAWKLEYEVLAQDPNNYLALDRISQIISKLHGFEQISTDFKRRADVAEHSARQISGGSSYVYTEAAKSLSLFYEIEHERIFYSQDIELLVALEQVIKPLNENSTQLLLGDTGVGKELVARIIHEQVFKDSEKPFVPVNCGGITESIFENEMFGYVPGAYTGADRKGRDGYFITANGGTLFLDEIAEIPLSKQATLLRVLQEKMVRKVGSDKEKKVDFLLISATNKDLKALVKTGKFREDLYNRIKGAIPAKIPSLKERRKDISLLFMILLEKKYGLGKIPVDPEALEVLKEHPLSGNYRDLENIVERIASLGYVRIDAEKMSHLISIEDSEDLRGKSKLSSVTQERMRIWFSLEFKNKKGLLKVLKENFNKPKDKEPLNKMLSSIFLEIGEQVNWKDLQSVITLCITDRILSEEKVTIFEKLFDNHMSKLATIDKKDNKIISQWIYPDDMENFRAFRRSKPNWVK